MLMRRGGRGAEHASLAPANIFYDLAASHLFPRERIKPKKKHLHHGKGKADEVEDARGV